MNCESKFTPGPWRFWRHVNEKYPGMSQTAVFGSGDKRFVMIAQTQDDGAAVPEQTVEEVIANAHLIAVCPEMFYLMHDLMKLVENVCFGGVVVSDEERDRASKLLERGYEIDKKAMVEAK